MLNKNDWAQCTGHILQRPNFMQRTLNLHSGQFSLSVYLSVCLFLSPPPPFTHKNNTQIQLYPDSYPGQI